jgi:hypothetical protein
MRNFFRREATLMVWWLPLILALGFVAAIVAPLLLRLLRR